jgi:hypothetical protein
MCMTLFVIVTSSNIRVGASGLRRDWPYVGSPGYRSDSLGFSDFGVGCVCGLHGRFHHHRIPALVAAIAEGVG